MNYIVSSRREAKAESSGTSYRGRSSPSEVRVEIPSTADPKGSHTRPSQKPVDSVRTLYSWKGVFYKQRKQALVSPLRQSLVLVSSGLI